MLGLASSNYSEQFSIHRDATNINGSKRLGFQSIWTSSFVQPYLSKTTGTLGHVHAKISFPTKVHNFQGMERARVLVFVNIYYIFVKQEILLGKCNALTRTCLALVHFATSFRLYSNWRLHSITWGKASIYQTIICRRTSTIFPGTREIKLCMCAVVRHFQGIPTNTRDFAFPSDLILDRSRTYTAYRRIPRSILSPFIKCMKVRSASEVHKRRNRLLPSSSQGEQLFAELGQGGHQPSPCPIGQRDGL